MDTTQRFSSKADIYAAHRWEYAPAAIDALIVATGLQPSDMVVDIGSGTGMVARHFVERGFQTLAIEPNAAMRAIAERNLSRYANFHSVDARAEITGLRDHSAALLTAGRALHWLPVEPTRREFLRVLKAEGWLAVMGVACTDAALDDAIKAARTAENGWDLDNGLANRHHAGISAFFGDAPVQEIHVPGVIEETWTQFRGRMLSFSPAPDAGAAGYDRYLAAIKAIFDRFAVQGHVAVAVSTDATIGHLRSD